MSFRAAAMPSRVRSEMSRPSKCAIAPKTWNTSSPAGRRGVEALLETDQVDAAGLEAVDGFEQLAQRASQTVEPGDAQAVAGRACSMSSTRPGRSERFPEATSVNRRMAPASSRRFRWAAKALVGGRDAGVAQRVARTGGGERTNIDRFGDGFSVHTVRSVTGSELSL